LAKARRAGKWGWINRKGKVVIPLRFDVVTGFDDARGLARIGVGENCGKEENSEENDGWQRHSWQCRWGIINARGREIISPRFDGIGAFDDQGLAVVSRAGKWGIVDVRGREIVPVRFSELYFGGYTGNAAALAREGNTWIWFDRKGRAVIPAHVRNADAGQLQPWKSARNRMGYVDPEGRIVVAPRFDEVSEMFEAGKAKVKLKGRWIWIDARSRGVKK
jgi:hypothetical protein